MVGAVCAFVMSHQETSRVGLALAQEKLGCGLRGGSQLCDARACFPLYDPAARLPAALPEGLSPCGPLPGRSSHGSPEPRCPNGIIPSPCIKWASSREELAFIRRVTWPLWSTPLHCKGRSRFQWFRKSLVVVARTVYCFHFAFSFPSTFGAHGLYNSVILFWAPVVPHLASGLPASWLLCPFLCPRLSLRSSLLCGMAGSPGFPYLPQTWNQPPSKEPGVALAQMSHCESALSPCDRVLVADFYLAIREILDWKMSAPSLYSLYPARCGVSESRRLKVLPT